MERVTGIGGIFFRARDPAVRRHPPGARPPRAARSGPGSPRRGPERQPQRGTMDDTAATTPPAEAQELELADEDILDAMQDIPGYLDITTGDFRELYHLAHRHAIDRLLSGLRAQA